jgi:hypothetical protein
MITEEQALEMAKNPEKIVDAIDCNIIVGYLNGAIVDLALEEFTGEIAANNSLAILMNIPNKTNKMAEVEWKGSEIYRKWRLMKLELAKLRAYRKVLQKKEELLTYTSRQTRSNYERAI